MKMNYTILVLLLLLACKKNEDIVQKPFDPLLNGYQLIWNDEFNGDSLDTTKWSYRALGKRRLAINTKESTFLNGNGQLCITMTKNGDEYFAGMIGTQSKFENLYGYYECKVKMNSIVGPHTAFWLQSPLISKQGTPEEVGTEVDIFEYMPVNSEIILHNLYWGYADSSIKNVCKSTYYPQIKKGYHLIGVDWSSDGYTFYTDGYETFRTDSAVSGVPLYMILSAEISGNWGDVQLNNADTVFFDYVRVYSKIENAGGH